MKFIKILKYIERSFENKPSFLILMKNNEEKRLYISNGCKFVEYTKANIALLVRDYDCQFYIDELLTSKGVDMSSVIDAVYMFYGCSSLNTERASA